MLASLIRVAAERTGLYLNRSVLERLVRNGSLAIALSLTNLNVKSAPELLVLVGIGYGAYAVVEVGRVVAMLCIEPPKQMAITMALDAHGEVVVTGSRVAG
jgi:hypothetical protein